MGTISREGCFNKIQIEQIKTEPSETIRLTFKKSIIYIYNFIINNFIMRVNNFIINNKIINLRSVNKYTKYLFINRENLRNVQKYFYIKIFLNVNNKFINKFIINLRSLRSIYFNFY